VLNSVIYRLMFICKPGSSVGKATGYGLDGLGIESRWGARCYAPVQTSPPSLLYNGYWFFPRGKEWPGRDTDPSPPSCAVGHERVELYLYSPMGCMACTEPQCLYSRAIPLLPLWAVRPVQSLSAVELYLYSPYGPYGVYRASVPVQ
jgi:hypothetical protein